MESPGIMDSELLPYLKAITKYYKANESKWSSFIKNNQFDLLKNARESADRRKNLDIAAQSFREQGNAFFKALDFTQALELYTKSISAAHEGPLAALAYFNRSAALFQMKLYEDCIKDIDRAISSGYPNQQNMYSLHLRKAKCLKFLNRNYDGCLAKTKKAIKDNNKGAAAKRLEELVASKMEEPEPVFNVQLPKPNDESCKLPELSYGQNPEVPCFSSAIDLVHSNELGRHIIANRDINTGDVLIVEESIITSMYSYLHWNFCNFCFKYCNTHLIPGKSCGYMMYCSKNCRDSDRNAELESIFKEVSHHPTSFKHFKLDESRMVDAMDVALAVQSMVIGLTNIFGLDNIKQTVLENKPIASLLGDLRTRGFQNGKFQEITLKALFSLEDNFDKSDLHSASQYAFCMCRQLRITPDQFLTVGAFFAKLYRVVLFNYKTVDYFKANYKDGPDQKRLTLGLGMYLATSLVNHSCDSNMYHVSYGSSIVFRAKCPIKKGEQLTDCYDRPSTKFNFEQRQSSLWETHRFKCRCSACLDPSSTTLDHLPLFPMQEMNQWFVDAGLHSSITNGWETGLAIKLAHCCALRYPATKQMLPKMLALLQLCHASGKKSNKFYFALQKCIQNHFRTEGNCLFFGNAKGILSGELDYGK